MGALPPRVGDGTSGATRTETCDLLTPSHGDGGSVARAAFSARPGESAGIVTLHNSAGCSMVIRMVMGVIMRRDENGPNEF